MLFDVKKLAKFAFASTLAILMIGAGTASASETVALKNALYAAGYNIQNVSPTMDDATRAALTKFQQDQGLNTSGLLDEATKKALGMVEVQVAQAQAASTQPASSGSAAAPQAAAPAEEAKEEEIEEDEDGGWSFF